MKQEYYVCVDIGGTKSAVSLITNKGDILARKIIRTTKGKGNWQPTIDFFIEISRHYMEKKGVQGIGISCGGPLNIDSGIIISPPNLPGWESVPIVEILTSALKIPVALENDANAGAMAEWIYGAGKGYNNIVFLTFGTGLGAGLILNGKPFSGSNGLGGEVGHIRLADDGPIGFNKRGSFEGFCSGKGLSQMMAFELICLKESIGENQIRKKYKELGKITGKDVVDWAKEGDLLALKVVKKCGNYLGKGLSILIDILNPEIIIVGSMGVRLGELLFEPARTIIQREAIPESGKACKIVEAALGERIGDYAALCVALTTKSKA